jgi:rod shape determining protein RodA
LNTASRISPFSPVFRNLVDQLWRIDVLLLSATSFLIAVGLSTLRWSQQTQGYFDKQTDFMWVGLGLLLVFSKIPYTFWTKRWVVIPIYLANLGLLLAVMLKGHSAQGAQRWLAVGPITLQPSEIAKLVVIFTLAAWLGRRPIKSFFDIFKLIAVILPPAVLVFKQPDLGTSLTLVRFF